MRPVDRVALHEQLSSNSGVISLYTGKAVEGFRYTYEDVCTAIRKTLDACFPPVAPRGTDRVTDGDGFVIQHDNWTSWTVSRPFDDVGGARDYLLRKTDELIETPLDLDRERDQYRQRMQRLQSLVGETVIIDYPVDTGFCTCCSRLGLDLFVYLYDRDPSVIADYVEAHTNRGIRRLHC